MQQQEQQEQQQQQRRRQEELLLARRLFGALSSLAISREEAARLDGMLAVEEGREQLRRDYEFRYGTSSFGTSESSWPYSALGLAWTDDSNWTFGPPLSQLESMPMHVIVRVFLFVREPAIWSASSFFGAMDEQQSDHE